MPTCRAVFGILSGHSIIEAGGTLYIWSLDQGLQDAAGWHLGMWLQMEDEQQFEMEDEHPFLKVIGYIKKELTFVRFITHFGSVINPEMPPDLRARIAALLEKRLEENDWLEERAKPLFLSDPPFNGLDITLAPKEGRLGSIFKEMFDMFGTTTLPPPPSKEEAVRIAIEHGFQPTAGIVLGFQDTVARQQYRENQKKN